MISWRMLVAAGLCGSTLIAGVSAAQTLRIGLASQGLAFTTPEKEPFKKQLAGVYATWKEKLGSKCWKLLEESVGKFQT